MLRPLVGGRIRDKQMLLMLRMVLVIFALCVMMFALNSQSSMFQMVQNAYKVTLVAAFTPLAFGLFWRGATPQGAMMSIVLGLAAWGVMELSAPDALLPPQIVGLGAAVFGMLAGSLAPQVCPVGHPPHASSLPQPSSTLPHDS